MMMILNCRLLLLLSAVLLGCHDRTVTGFSLVTSPATTPVVRQHESFPRRTRNLATRLQMGFWERLTGKDNQEGDFINLNDAQDAQEYGPGPLVVLYNIPEGVLNEEVQDMMADGAPLASGKGITLYRIRVDDEASNQQRDPVLSMAMKDALEGIADGKLTDQYTPAAAPTTTTNNIVGMPPIVLALFSGFRNDEMLQAYQILASEVYQEAQIEPACAKAVPNAMDKPLQQVIEEIGGDHREAMLMMQQDQQETGES
ncbi:expressed unknown protein [Seminavis robusta]|uniref:Uncharacterized protein n=1 Tax=Seminavis robusta TaxID=568900 RepID=A0A9N8DXC8_9STRA|nr:expressed unknown protein [Seminavis robusta]|eukprot:Sro317_g115800.1 n/a (257) ;mRNA; r:66041-66811